MKGERGKRSIAFYNVENLFDLKNNRLTFDDDYTAKGLKNWTAKRYRNKIQKLSRTIPKIGETETGFHPALVGLCEVENHRVLHDLVNAEAMRPFGYKFVHFDSPDERGIDTALLYDENVFKLLNAETINTTFKDENGEIDYTRDILKIEGEFIDERSIIFVVHFPSKRFDDVNLQKRKLKLNVLRKEINSLLNKENDRILVLGDFNENPNINYFREILHTNHNKEALQDNELYNPFLTLFGQGKGSLVHKKQWMMYDQILMTKKMTDSFLKAAVFEEGFLREWSGRYAGNPFRTFAGKKYLGGYSDHLPVYTIFNF